MLSGISLCWLDLFLTFSLYFYMLSNLENGGEFNHEKQDFYRKIAQALYTINRHAKAAPKPQHLYTIKKEAIEKLLKEKKAKKIGLHFSNNPKYSNQHSTLLIKV